MKKEKTVKKYLISKALDPFFESAAQLAAFGWRSVREAVFPPFEFQETLRQCYLIGVNSFPLVWFTGLILGLVLVLQSQPTLVEFGAGSYLPAMSSISIIREVGPLVTALICAGKIGSGISAEIGSMKVTEQIDAMEVSGTNPFKFLVATRIMACMLMVPILCIYADVLALLGAFLGSNITGNITFSFFFNRVFEALHFTDIFPAFIKTFIFGFSIGLVGCTKGYHSQNGTEGVGMSANESVVVAMLSVIVIDMVVTQISGMLGYI